MASRSPEYGPSISTSGGCCARRNTLPVASTPRSSFWLIALVYVVLGLLDVDDVRRKVQALDNRVAGGVLLNGSAATAAKFRKYMLVRTQMSAITGLLVGIFAWITGLPFALEWGLIAFALNYIPFIGPFIATLFPTLLAMTQFESWQAVLGVFVCLNIIQFVVGSYVEPRVAGNMLSISPTVVLFAIFLWTYLWGLFGTFIGVPITLAILTFCGQHPSSRWIADLLGGPKQPTQAKPYVANPGFASPGYRPRPQSRSSPAAADKAARPVPAASVWIRKRVDSASVASITGDGAEMIFNAPQAPIQSMWRWPCMITTRSAKGLRVRTNQLPLTSAVPIRSENVATAHRVFDQVVMQRHDPARLRETGRAPRQDGASVQPRPGRARW